MKITLSNTGKRYDSKTTFRGIHQTFESNHSYALLGANGSGKSTLLRIIGGLQAASTGKITYTKGDKTIHPDAWYQHISFCAPAMNLIEEMTLQEFLTFHFRFKKPVDNISPLQIIRELNLEQARNQFIGNYSSGMKQRVKLAQAFFSDTDVVLLDEPCSNLDQAGIVLYQSLLKKYSHNRIVIIASNDEREYPEVPHVLDIEKFK